MAGSRRQRASRRGRTWNWEIVVVGLVVAVVAAVAVVRFVRHLPVEPYSAGPPTGPPWNPEWPELPRVERDLHPEVTKLTYAFAAAEPKILEKIPCFCGCRSQGHRSELDCYVKRFSAAGVVTEWNPHAVACPLSADITVNTMQWLEEGVPIATIRGRIERRYGRRGPMTPTPGVP